MKKIARVTLATLALTLISFAPVRSARAQDPVKVDPKHYSVIFENDQVRVLRIHRGSHEKSVMHDRAAGVVVFLTNTHTRFTSPDGKTSETTGKAGEVRWNDAGKVASENLADRPERVIYVELKGKTP